MGQRVQIYVLWSTKMDILIIGNGFDLANGMKTRYSDFLKFAIRIKYILEKKDIDEELKCDKKIEKILEKNCENVRNNIFERRDLLETLFLNNVWIDYFVKKTKCIPDRWVDFEEEIGCVIHSIYDEKNFEDLRLPWTSGDMVDCIQKYCEEIGENKDISVEEEKERYILILEEHLIRLEKALELYLREYVMQAGIECSVPEVREILEKNKDIQIISFNYTDTIEKYYGINNRSIVYIHGRLGEDTEYKKTDLILGIDDKDDRLIHEMIFLPFYKYCRREIKGASHRTKKLSLELMEHTETLLKAKRFYTENKVEMDMIEGGDKDYQEVYAKYLQEFEDRNKKTNLYIFGHSLAVSDREYLMDFLTNEQIRTTVFFHDEKQKTDQIKNLITMLGRGPFVDYTSRDRIVFCEQR